MIIPTPVLWHANDLGIPQMDSMFLGYQASFVSTQLEETLSFVRERSDYAFEVPQNPWVILSTVAFVTASDMIPFVPCQPLAISLGAKYGLWAFPICVVGQTLAGVLAFSGSRKVSDSQQLQDTLDSLGENGAQKFLEFRETLLKKKTVKNDVPRTTDMTRDKSILETYKEEGDEEVMDEKAVFLALVGLRLAPFFPFSAGNYLLGGGTTVGLRPFVFATILGCLLSNAASVLAGMGGAELFLSNATP